MPAEAELKLKAEGQVSLFSQHNEISIDAVLEWKGFPGVPEKQVERGWVRNAGQVCLMAEHALCCGKCLSVTRLLQLW